MRFDCFFNSVNCLKFLFIFFSSPFRSASPTVGATLSGRLRSRVATALTGIEAGEEESLLCAWVEKNRRRKGRQWWASSSFSVRGWRRRVVGAHNWSDPPVFSGQSGGWNQPLADRHRNPSRRPYLRAVVWRQCLIGRLGCDGRV